LLIDTSAADVSLTAGTADLATSTDLTLTGGNASGSTVEGSKNIDGLGTFDVTDRLTAMGTSGNPTASSVSFFIEQSGSTALVAGNNAAGNEFAAHICAVSTDTNCSSTFFQSNTGQIATPLPAAFWFMLTGLAGLIGFGRKWAIPM
jgi:hypothetical protein